MTAFIAVVRNNAPEPALRAAGATVVLDWSDLTTCAEADDVPTVLFDLPEDAGAAALAPALTGELAAVLAVLQGAVGAAVATTRPVVDTLKLVDSTGVLVGTADRADHRFVGAPIAARLGAFRAVARELGPSEVPAVLAALTARGVVVVSCDR